MAKYKNLLFKDAFTGSGDYPPDRGKWSMFYTRENPSVQFSTAVITPTEEGCLFAAAVDSNGWGGVNLMSRAEFKVPFKTRVAVKPTDYGFYLYLMSPDVRDGHFLGTSIYGMWVAIVSGTADDYKFKLALSQDYAPKTHTSDATWSLGTEYLIEMEVTPYTADTRKLNIALTIRQASNGMTVWQVSDWCDQSLSGTLRCCLSAMAQASGSIEFYVRGFYVFGNQSRKAKAVVTAVTGTVKRVITDDVIDFKVTLRDGSHPQASLTLRNEGNKYAELGVKTEIEIRAGTEAVLYLLFRGYIEAPERTYPPSRLKVESSSGYAKRLDFREAYNKIYINKKCGSIVKDLIETYFEDVFTADNVADGVTTSAEYHAVSVAKIIKELADANAYVWGVDYNKDVYFIPLSQARSVSSLPFKGKSDQLSISNREIDEVINYVRQVGKTVSGVPYEYTAHDASSESLYWRRDKTFRDISLSSQAATQAKAEGLLQKYKELKKEIALTTPHIVPIDLYCIASITNTEVGLNNYNGEVKSVEWSFSAKSVRTTVLFQDRGFKLADALVAYHEAAYSIPAVGPGETEEPQEEPYGFVLTDITNGFLPANEQMLVADAIFFNPVELSRCEDQVYSNSWPMAWLISERRQLEFSMVESVYLNHGGGKQIGETCLYLETHAYSMNENIAGEDAPSLQEDLAIMNT
ncbi:MAG: hypothetical protein WHU54_02255 [Candidatus Bathyarchaeia archaeon]